MLSPFRVFVIGLNFLPKNYKDVYDLSQRKGKEFKMPIPGNLLTTAMAMMPHTDVDQALKTALSMDIPFWPQLPNLNLYRKTEFWIKYTLLSLHITSEFYISH